MSALLSPPTITSRGPIGLSNCVCLHGPRLFWWHVGEVPWNTTFTTSSPVVVLRLEYVQASNTLLEVQNRRGGGGGLWAVIVINDMKDFLCPREMFQVYVKFEAPHRKYNTIGFCLSYKKRSCCSQNDIMCTVRGMNIWKCMYVCT